MVASKDSIGIVETQYFTFGQHPLELTLENGEKLGPITLAYETYGKLNAAKSNAILILHALTGDAHAAGFHDGEKSPGWWDSMVGPGKAFDTERYFIICSNILGGCKGSTGPSSLNPVTGKPYGLDSWCAPTTSGPRPTPTKLQQCCVMSQPVLAEGATVTIDLLKGYFSEQLRVNGDDDPKEWWQVFDRTTGRRSPKADWSLRLGDAVGDGPQRHAGGTRTP